MRPVLLRRHTLVGILCLMPAMVAAQTDTLGQAQQRSTSASTPSADRPPSPGVSAQPPKQNRSRDYVIGPGDSLSLSVFGVGELSQVSRVSNSGKIHFARLGILTASGKTVAAMEADVASILKEREIVREPWVTMSVIERRAHPVYVLGEILTGGQFQITDEMYLNDLLTLAQGFNEVASPVGFLYRRKVDTTPSDVPTPEGDEGMYAIPIDFKALQSGTNPELNLRLQGGDILYVPQRRKEFLFVIGQVAAPGIFDFSDRKGFRLTQAVAQAGGPIRGSKPTKMTLVRYSADNTRQEMEINFKKVLNGEEPDIEMQFGDVLYVPGSKAKSAGLALLGILPGMATQRVMQR